MNMSDSQPKFSVIIPTLQRSPELHPLVEQCAAHPLVVEVLVINNSESPLSWPSSKVRVLQQSQNIYVNPAWNLGAKEARGQYLAIVNDDVRFENEVFDYCAKLLSSGRWGIIGPDKTCFRFEPSGEIGHRFAGFANLHYGYGTFMALRASDYNPIPDDMLIWGGDDWLFLSQKRANAALVSTRFLTEDGVTSSSPEFKRMRQAENQVSSMHLSNLPKRWWMPLARWIDRFRMSRHRFHSLIS